MGRRTVSEEFWIKATVTYVTVTESLSKGHSEALGIWAKLAARLHVVDDIVQHACKFLRKSVQAEIAHFRFEPVEPLLAFVDHDRLCVEIIVE